MVFILVHLQREARHGTRGGTEIAPNDSVSPFVYLTAAKRLPELHLAAAARFLPPGFEASRKDGGDRNSFLSVLHFSASLSSNTTKARRNVCRVCSIFFVIHTSSRRFLVFFLPFVSISSTAVILFWDVLRQPQRKTLFFTFSLRCSCTCIHFVQAYQPHFF